MNIIKGLITKDLLQLKSYKKTLISYIIIFICVALSQENIDGIQGMLIIMLTLGLGMFGMASFNYDELAKADRYILSLPTTKKEIVLSKYFLVISLTVIGAIIGMLISCIIIFVIEKQLPDIGELISFALGGILGIGFVAAIQIPFIYKYGAEKGRLQVFIFTGIMAFVLGGIFFIIEKMNINFSVNNILKILTEYLPIILILLTTLIYYISYKVSYKIYSKKEI